MATTNEHFHLLSSEEVGQECVTHDQVEASLEGIEAHRNTLIEQPLSVQVHILLETIIINGKLMEGNKMSPHT